jgi:adenine-specific DNA-methyltransferase
MTSSFEGSLVSPLRTGNAQRSLFGSPPDVWRPIHYLGSKLRLCDRICDLIDELGGGTVSDLFAGSGTIALALSRSRSVLATDIQEYSRVICTALLEPTPFADSVVADLLARVKRRQHELESCLEPILEYEQRALERSEVEPDLLCDLVDSGSLISGRPGGAVAKALQPTQVRLQKADVPLLATRYFGGKYFSFRQALFIDSVLQEKAGETWLAALLSTASSLVNSIGKQFAQPIRPRRKDGTIKPHVIRQICRDRTMDAPRVFSGWLSRYRNLSQQRTHVVKRGDYRDVLAEIATKGDVGVIYADPPYTRDHYSRFYHVLETLCLQDWPEVTSTFHAGPTSHGLYRRDRHQSPFCIKSQAPLAFTELFVGARGLPMLVSYSPFVDNGHPRMMTLEAIAEIAKRYYREVTIASASLTHSKLNKAELHRHASDRAEAFLLCR